MSYNVKHGMSLGQAQAEKAVQHRIMREEGPPKQKSVAWAIAKIAIGVIMFLIGLAGFMAVIHP